MDNKALALIFGAIALLCATAFGISFVVSQDDAPAPVPTSTAPAPDPVETSDPLRDILEETWNEQSYSDQQLLCTYFKVDPEGAYDSFSDGAGGEILPEATFDEFLTAECSTI